MKANWTVTEDDGQVVVTDGSTDVCVVGPIGYPVIDEQAALIAAAPAMLTALESIVDCYDTFKNHDDFAVNVGEFIYHANKAIAQAKGAK